MDNNNSRKFDIRRFAGSEKVLLYILAPLTVFAVFMLNFLIKGIYPFGSETIDYYDMGQEVLADYYHVYDFIHGSKSVFYDWYTGLGTNMSNNCAGTSMHSLFNLFFYFVKRDALLESMSFFVALKCMCMTGAFGYALLKLFPRTDSFIKYLLSVGYGLCGFVMMNYTLITWFDVAVFFPILVAFTAELVHSGKMTGYVILLAISLTTSYYITAMALIYIFVGVGLYIFIEKISRLHLSKSVFAEKQAAADASLSVSASAESEKSSGMENRHISTNYHLFRLGMGTLAALLLSMVVLMPQLYQMFSSTRYGNNGGIREILFAYESPYKARWWSLLGCALPFALLIAGIVRHFAVKGKKNLKAVCWMLCMIFAAAAELFFENVNLVMHFGSYIHYPIRNGFIIYAVIAFCASYSSGYLMEGAADAEDAVPAIDRTGKAVKEDKTGKDTEKVPSALRRVLSRLTPLAALAAIAFAVFVFKYMISKDDLQIGNIFRITETEGLIFVILFTAAAFMYKDKLTKWVMGIILLMQLVINSYIFIGPLAFTTGYTEEPEQEAEYIRISNQLAYDFNIRPDYADRIKNPDESLNANYGFVLRRPTVTNSTHLVKEETQNGLITLGYSSQFTRLLDAGGTAFTDAMLHITDTISVMAMDDTLYEKTAGGKVTTDHITGEEQEYGLYSNRYVFPYGMILDGMESVDALKASEDIISFHNYAYRALLNGGLAAIDKSSTELSADGILDEQDINTLSDEKVNGDIAEFVCMAAPGDNTITVKGSKLLYFWATCSDQEYENIELSIDGRKAAVPSIHDVSNVKYPAHFNNGTVYLGNYSDMTVTVNVIKDTDADAPDYLMGFFTIDLDKLKLAADIQNAASDDTMEIFGSTLKYDTTGHDGEVLLLPIAYDEGFTVSINGVGVKAEDVKGMFTAIPLCDGDNNIVLKFAPSGFYSGLVISCIAFALCLAAFIGERVYKKRKKTPDIDGKDGAWDDRKMPVLEMITEKVYMPVWGIVVIGIYVIMPVISVLARFM